MADAEGKKTITQKFMKVAGKAAFYIGVGLLIGGIIDFTLFHNHPLGGALIDVFNEPLMGVYDFAANTIGLPEYTTAAAGPTYGEISDLGDSVITDAPGADSITEPTGDTSSAPSGSPAEQPAIDTTLPPELANI